MRLISDRFSLSKLRRQTEVCRTFISAVLVSAKQRWLQPMEFSQLEFFVAVVAEGSFSKAAERVFRTQPAVSIAIRRLEDEIGAQLFERSQKTPALTEVGELVYDYAFPAYTGS